MDFTRKDSGTRTAALAKDETARRLITSYLLARLGGEWSTGLSGENAISLRTRDWAVVLEKAGLGDVPDAGEIAWLAYQAGDFSLAEKWVALADAASVPSNWIRAKLALRAGNLGGAEPFLARVTASKALVSPARSVALGELGSVRITLGSYTAALDAFRDGGHWEDAAYIAERVLTLEELTAYVDEARKDTRLARLPICKWDFGLDEEEMEEYERKNFQTEISHLLARRLARAEKHNDALRYFPPEPREHYEKYLRDTREAFDVANNNLLRSHAFRLAARNMRKNGMAMLGTELGPDNAISSGGSDSDGISGTRLKSASARDIGSPTADELERVKKHTVPEARFHYRYRAADLAWWAASLMPNDTEETARVLDEAGGWLKARDPKAANRFFQALVIRCGNTKLGKAAAEKNWFVENYLHYATAPNERGRFPAELPVFDADGPGQFDWQRYIDEATDDAERAFRAHVAVNSGYSDARDVTGAGSSSADEMTRHGLAARALEKRNAQTVKSYRRYFKSQSAELLTPFNEWLAVEESALEKLRYLVSGSWNEGAGAGPFASETHMFQQISLEQDLAYIRTFDGWSEVEHRCLGAVSPEQNERKIAAVRKDLARSPKTLSAFEDWLATEQSALAKWRVFAEKARAVAAKEANTPERANALAAAILARELEQQLSRSQNLQN
jgi:hypothetical protein